MTNVTQHTDARLPIPSLLVDLYELTMAQAYFDRSMMAPATFSLFARHLPQDWGFFLAAGLDDVLHYLASLAFSPRDIEYLDSTGLFTPPFLDYLGRLRFTGSVRALPEGTPFFPNEPVVEVTAPVVEAQLVESVVLNQVHFQSIIATKAARCLEAAQGRQLIDFSLRRTHGVDAGLKVARCAYLAGFDSTSNVLAGQRYGVPIAGTMAHSYVECFDDEEAAFRAYARSYPDRTVLLVDTYDTVEGTKLAAEVGLELGSRGHRLRGVRLDSGDLIALSFEARAILNAVGLQAATITASGSVDEHLIAKAAAVNAPIDAFGVGSKLGVSADAPYLDMAYKLVEYDGRPRLKLSAGKGTWPGPKQVWRLQNDAGNLRDYVTLASESGPGAARPLLREFRPQQYVLAPEPLTQQRARAREALASLPGAIRRLIGPATAEVVFSEQLIQLRDRMTADIRTRTARSPAAELRSHDAARPA